MRRRSPAASWAGAALALALVTPAATAEPGRTCWRGGEWFQDAGQDEQGRQLWLYPHLDGVPELFVARPGAPWEGSLGSRFDPEGDRFQRRFNAAAVADELTEERAPSARRREAAILLATFVRLHPGGTPYYLDPWAERIAAALDDDARAQVAAAVARHRTVQERLPSVGTRVLPPVVDPRDARDFLQLLVGDGYLDVAVVAGNSLDAKTDTIHGPRLLGELARRWVSDGFTATGFREQGPSLLERTTRLLGATVRVRIHLTAGATGTPAARRTVANFVEGLARADVVIYVGHSNKTSGSYYLSEDKTAFSRFALGLDHAGADLAHKASAAGPPPHQVVVLHSCSSFVKYCRPIEAFYGLGAAEGGAIPGLIGSADPASFDEFVPRTAALIDGLLAGDGPEGLARRIRAARPPKGTPFLLRGVLQRRRTFVVPAGVRVVAAETLPGRAQWVVGRGTDGERYYSTEVFPQDRAGEVVQVVRWGDWLYGLYRDGRLARVGDASGGAAEPAPEAGATALRALAPVRAGRRELLLGLTVDGRLRVLAGGSRRVVTAPGADAPLAAVGNDPAGRLIALDTDDRAYAWRRSRRRWDPLEAPAALLPLAPTLRGGPQAGELQVGLRRDHASPGS